MAKKTKTKETSKGGAPPTAVTSNGGDNSSRGAGNGEKASQELMLENSKLKLLIKQLKNEINDLSNSILLRGYLFKWKDNVMTFGTKWSLKYFILNGNILNYYHNESHEQYQQQPVKTINLKNCMILNEGKKGNYFIISICLKSENDNEMIRGPMSGSLLRLSSDNESNMKQWIDMLCKACEFGEEENESENGTMEFKKESRPSMRNKDQPSRHLIQVDQSSSKPKDIKKAGKSFAGSRNIHIRPQISPLSVHANRQNYRGFFNLVVIILLMSHFRIIVDNLAKYGYSVTFFSTSTEEIDPQATSPWSAPQPLAVLASWGLMLGLVLWIEVLAQRGYLSNQTTLVIQSLLSMSNVIGSCCWVWFSKCSPLLGILYLLESVILWMKLISYVHCNRDLRITQQEQKKLDLQNSFSPRSPSRSSRLPSSPSPLSPSSSSQDNNAKPPDLSLIYSEMSGLELPVLSYPMNLTYSNLLFFCIIPTLCYQLNYPRNPTIRWKYVATILIRMIFTVILILYVVNKHITPALEDLMTPIHEKDYLRIFQQFIHISLPNTYVWLLGFYCFFHLWLNLLGELTRFSDREFYRDWWNARTIDEYWRLWNLPVHHWMLRHLYYPIIRLPFMNKKIAVFIAFLFSALLHEVIISIPFRRISYHAFLGMLVQAPLVTVTRKVNEFFKNQVAGNVFFWLTFCIIGQPVGVILYYYESWLSSAATSASVSTAVGAVAAVAAAGAS